MKGKLINFEGIDSSGKKTQSNLLAERLKNEGSFSKKNILPANAYLSPKQIKKYCSTSQECKELITSVIRRFSLSARAYDRILKVSRTIADLAQSETIQLPHIAEAIQYRNELWGQNT